MVWAHGETPPTPSLACAHNDVCAQSAVQGVRRQGGGPACGLQRFELIATGTALNVDTCTASGPQRMPQRPTPRRMPSTPAASACPSAPLPGASRVPQQPAHAPMPHSQAHAECPSSQRMP
eukprot:360147-Chlamydomonas_euryale.AAC.1